MNTFIQQGCVKLIKSDSKDILLEKDFYFENAVLFNVLFIKESWKSISGSKKNKW